VEHAELVRIPRESLELIVRAQPQSEQLLWGSAVARIKEAGRARRDLRHSEFTQVALDSGLVQGSSILVIDLERCTRCDDCVRACAATHGGRPRFVREGDKIQNLLVARSCYHCRDPVCLVGCPTGAIHRAGVADVVEIDDEVCIGCSTCANNCPYDAIVMHETGEAWPDDMVPTGLRGRPRRVASKCDLCHDRGHEPACVTNCPQACAFRVGSVEDLRDLLTGEEE
jgi:Fe-S-cluster-containing dehydrogenase component